MEQSAAKGCFSLGENIHRSCCLRRVAIIGARGELMTDDSMRGGVLVRCT